MKKVLAIFLLGQLLVFSYIFNTSIYEVYGLTHIGDTELTKYLIADATPEQLEVLYQSIDERQLPLQIIKTPMSEDDMIVYEIYHSSINDINRFVGLSKTQYRYFTLTKEDFVDSTGYFYSDLSDTTINEIAKEYGLKIQTDDTKNSLSYETIIKNNLMNLIILLVVTQVIMIGYSLSKSKEYAIKKLFGYSSFKIVLSRIKEVLELESIILILVVSINSIYYILKAKWNLFYFIFLIVFLFVILSINLLLLFFTQQFVKYIDICAVLKNKIFSKGMNTCVKVIKIFMIIIITLSVTEGINYYQLLQKDYSQISEYEILNNLYCSYGVNADEAKKIRNNNQSLKIADQVKEMYLSNYRYAYLMDENVTELSLAGPGLGLSPEELHESYLYNYAILNDNYIRDYTDINLPTDLPQNETLVLVPLKYKKLENEIYDYYSKKVNELYNYNKNYEDSSLSTNENIQLRFIDNGYTNKILSSYQYEEDIDITLTDSIIIVDTGRFASGYYYNLLSSSKLAFKLDSKEVFMDMIQQRKLDNLFYTHTLIEPFQIQISNYKFLLSQSITFITIFLITIIFIIYISNYMEIVIKRRKYAVEFLHGYSHLSILNMDILITLVMLLFGVILKIIDVDIEMYILLVILDLVTHIYFYRRIVIKNLKNILNGG